MPMASTCLFQETGDHLETKFRWNPRSVMGRQQCLVGIVFLKVSDKALAVGTGGLHGAAKRPEFDEI